jgi:hypothetical protein
MRMKNSIIMFKTETYISMPVSQTSFCCFWTSYCSGESGISLFPRRLELAEERLPALPYLGSSLLPLPVPDVVEASRGGSGGSAGTCCSAGIDGLTYKSRLHSTMHLRIDTRHSSPRIRMDFS